MLICRDCGDLATAELRDGYIVCPRCDARVKFTREYVEEIVRDEVNMEIKRMTIRGQQSKDFEENGILIRYVMEPEPDPPQFVYN